MEQFSITSWQISIAQMLFLLPLYVLIYPLSRWVCRYMACGGKALLYAYPYALSMMVYMGFISMAVLRNKLVDIQVDAYFALGLIKLLPFMILCNIWTQRYLKRRYRVCSEKSEVTSC